MSLKKVKPSYNGLPKNRVRTRGTHTTINVADTVEEENIRGKASKVRNGRVVQISTAKGKIKSHREYDTWKIKNLRNIREGEELKIKDAKVLRGDKHLYAEYKAGRQVTHYTAYELEGNRSGYIVEVYYALSGQKDERKVYYHDKIKEIIENIQTVAEGLENLESLKCYKRTKSKVVSHHI